MRSLILIATMGMASLAFAKPPADAKDAAASATPAPPATPLKKMTREQAARLDAAIMHMVAIEKTYADQIKKEEVEFLAEAREMCKAGGFTFEELMKKRVELNYKTGEARRVTPPVEPGQ